MRTTSRADGFNDTGGNADYLRTIVRRDAILKRADFNARTGKVYLPDTTAAALTVSLPKIPNDGAWVQVIDAFSKWATNNLTVNAGQNTISLNGAVAAATLVLNTNSADITIFWDRVNRVWRAFYIPVPTLGLTDGGVKTSGFVAEVNKKYVARFGASGTITFPASATAGDIISITYAGYYVYTHDPNGLNINTSSANYPLTGNQTYIWEYTGATDGWV